MKDKLIQAIDSYMESEGVDVRSGIRDAMTELLHLADENIIDIDELIIGAKDVFYTEKGCFNSPNK